MKTMLRALFTLMVLFALPGCAGGWRGGVVPAAWSDSAPAAAPTASSASAKPKAANGKSTAVTAEGVQFVFAGDASTVNVAGEFNSWSTSADPLKKQANGTWTLTKALAPGKYAYKFVLNGTDWKADENSPETADDGYGGKNSVVVVTTGAAAAPAAPVAAAASNAGSAVSADGATFRYSGAGNTVHVAGEFNSWSTSADPMKKQADGSWTLTKALPAGKYMYKFVVDGTNWKEDPAATETADDGYGGKNAVMTVGAGAAAAPAAKPAAAAAAAPAASADGAKFKYSGPGNTVHVAGEFNSWSTSADPMKKQADGTWTLSKPLPAGKYAYKFVVDGTNWKEDPAATETADDGYGGKNALITVGAGAAAAPAAAPAAAAAAPAATGDGVTFRYSGPGGSVALAGEFNSWSTSADPMKKQADGSWTITKAIAPGKYPYKFVIDGTTWKEDAAAAEFADDGYGGKNSVVVVGGTAAGASSAASAAKPAAGAVKPLAAGAKPKAPKLGANGVEFTYAGAARTGVSVCGDFNSWGPTVHKMTQQADGTWTATIKLPAGTHAYKFLVDGSTWKQDEGNPASADDVFGGKNSIIVVK
jgi:1,4-alpha-glucan branching enzyme